MVGKSHTVHLARIQQPICILTAWAVTLMFDTVSFWQWHSQETLFEKDADFSNRLLKLLSQQAPNTETDPHTRTHTHTHKHANKHTLRQTHFRHAHINSETLGRFARCHRET